MKQRFSSLDIKVIAHELSQTLVSLRVSNIYDLSSRIFLLKFAKPNHRAQIVVDSGFRCHLTSFARTTAGTPSVFVTRLRKFLKTRRVTSVKQIGTDRILEIQFSDGQYRLFLEFYAGGNIVLCDKELKILALHRNVNEGAPHERIRQGSDYNVTDRQNVGGVPPLSKDRLKDGLRRWMEKQAEYEAQGKDQAQKKLTKKKGEALKKALSFAFNEFPPVLLDHALHTHTIDMTKTPEDALQDDALLDCLVAALQEADRLQQSLMAADPVKGYITGRPNTSNRKAQAGSAAPEDDASGSIIYNDFHPFRPKQVEDDPNMTILEFDGFNKTVDEFFSSIEGQKLESRLAEREANAKRKLDNAKSDQEKRIGGLQEVQNLNVRKAQAIEANLARVEEATAAINGLVAQGMDWIDIDKLIEQEQLRGNEVAANIKLPLKLHENTATLLLGEWDNEEDESVETDEGYHTDSEPSDSDDDEEEPVSSKTSARQSTSAAKPAADKRLAVDIDLALSGYSNARDYYDQKRTAAAKQEKTEQASVMALKSAQQKIEADLKRGLKQEKSVLRAVRTPLWFEKFIYFISSDGYLVVGGRDAQQNDIIYKRHLKKGDAYVHADLNGAASVVIKNNPATPDAPIPPATLSQAGNICVSTSSAWDSKAVMSAWWTQAAQVTKIAPTGDVLGPGNFHIKGEKNFLPPAQLLLGFAVMWRITDASKARHLKHRVPQDGAAQASEPARDDEDEGSVDGVEDEKSMNDDYDLPDDDEDEALADAADSDAEMLGDGPAAEEEKPAQDDEVDEDDQPAYINPLQGAKASRKGAEPPTEQTAHLNINGQDEDDQKIATQAAEDTTSDAKPSQAEESSGSASDVEDDAEDQPQASATAPKASNATTSQPSLPAPTAKTVNAAARGKRGKNKRKALKYANQDPEDREAAMAILGSKAGQDRAEAEAAAKREKAAEAEKQRARRKEQATKAQEQARERDARRAAEVGEGGEDDDEDQIEGGAVVDLDSLVPALLPGDEVLEAIPVCAPWSALGRYKYKVKLQPGSMKKGKAVREILHKWAADATKKGVIDPNAADSEKMWPKEIELIKGWREEEIFGAIPVSKVRVMMAGVRGGVKVKGNAGGKAKSGKKGK